MRTHQTIDPLIASVEFRCEPVIIRVNEFTEESAKDFTEQMRAACNSGQPVLPVVIDSYGGSIDSLFAMLADINAFKEIKPVATIAVGKAMSCGAALLTFGSPGYRYADANSRIMIHEVATVDGGKTTDFASSSEELQRVNEHLFALMSCAAKKKSNYFVKQISRRKNADWFLTAQEAQKIGIVDHIGQPILRRTVQVTYDFSL